jgi:hypothetical protein
MFEMPRRKPSRMSAIPIAFTVASSGVIATPSSRVTLELSTLAGGFIKEASVVMVGRIQKGKYFWRMLATSSIE